jgi:hypothetical protein
LQSPNKIDVVQNYIIIAFALALPGIGLWYIASKRFSGKKTSIKSTDIATAIWLISFLSVIAEISLSIWRYYPLAAYIFIMVVVLCIITLCHMDKSAK